MLKTIQLDSTSPRNLEILRAAGVKRLHPGWYTVRYNGVCLDCSTVVSATFNRKGQIRF